MYKLPTQFFTDHWEAQKALDTDIRQRGGCHISIISAGTVKRVRVVVPYSSTFIAKAKSLDGRYRSRTQVWTFKLSMLGNVVLSCLEIFGEENVIVNADISRSLATSRG